MPPGGGGKSSELNAVFSVGEPPPVLPNLMLVARRLRRYSDSVCFLFLIASEIVLIIHTLVGKLGSVKSLKIFTVLSLNSNSFALGLPDLMMLPAFSIKYSLSDLFSFLFNSPIIKIHS